MDESYKTDRLVYLDYKDFLSSSTSGPENERKGFIGKISGVSEDGKSATVKGFEVYLRQGQTQKSETHSSVVLSRELIENQPKNIFYLCGRITVSLCFDEENITSLPAESGLKGILEESIVILKNPRGIEKTCHSQE